jgi:hypothetical protein
MDFITKSGRDLAAGDLMLTAHAPVKQLSYANGLDGKDRRMIGGPGVDSAFALRVTLQDDSELILHPGQQVKVRA